MNVLIIVKPQSAGAQQKAEELAAQLRARGDTADIDCWNGASDPAREPNACFTGYKLIISLGGDGTVLFAARSAAPFNIPIMPVNMGTLGFIASTAPEHTLATLDAWQSGSTPESWRLMLDVRVERGGQFIFSESCLNDAVISADGIAKTIRLDAAALLDGVYEERASYRSDGLILATPTGSTAYSASAGGPILDPETEDIIINPICPFTLLHRPLVVPADSTLCISIPEGQRAAVMLTIDGQVTRQLETGDRVLVRKAAFKARLIAASRTTFYQALQRAFWAQ
ncbi:MAG: NAD(+)/NADH kinase [Spirochaetaceae bacterium]|jgi:NAD+ kinase|nr:NAD(+)/NADH kinase [Spirochaetaceae bacterium]